VTDSLFYIDDSTIRHVRKTPTFFSKYADHKIAKYAEIAYSHKLTWYIFGGMDSTAVI